MNAILDIVTDPRHDGWRAVLVTDIDAGQPWGDAFAPTLLIDRDGRAHLAAEVYQPAHGHRIETAYEHFADVDRFARYLRIHHGTSTVAVITGPDCTVLVFDTAAYRTHIGVTGGCDLTAEQTEWRAWLDGDVYGVLVQQRVPALHCLVCGHSEPERWCDLDAYWGFYGTGYGAGRALELLRDAAAAASTNADAAT
ncbi:hypothetical protein [Dactylosporangium sp. NPDC000521]|uniref:hypothetical protein n=1 Tax=Dactylosporangium sp. NPDC000521 TaxID=3363975 RepID=UPI00367DFB86